MPVLAAKTNNIEDVYNQYSKTVSQGTQVDISKISYADPRFKLENNLQRDVAKFVHFRHAQMEKELRLAQSDQDRQIIEKKYKNYQKVELQTIFANSAAAERWMGFEDSADLYPNLEYRTAGDNDVRLEHAFLDGIILPINDPFWIKHTPPLGFGCRCELVQTDEPANGDQYPGFTNTPVPKGFEFNPGVEQRLFSDNAGYYTSATKEDAISLTKTADSFISKISKSAVQQHLKKQKKPIPFSKINGHKNIKVSNRDIKDITTGRHENRPMRNALLFDLQNVLKEVTLVYSKPESKGRDLYDRWYYYKVKGFDNMYLNIVKTKYGDIKLHAITDSVKKQ